VLGATAHVNVLGDLYSTPSTMTLSSMDCSPLETHHWCRSQLRVTGRVTLTVPAVKDTVSLCEPEAVGAGIDIDRLL